MIALLGVLFIDLIVNHDVNWILAFALMIAGGLAIGAVHGMLVTRMQIQPFVVTLCGLLIYRGVARYYTEDCDRRLRFRRELPDAGMADRRPHRRVRLSASAQLRGPRHRHGDRLGGAAPLGVRPLSLRGRQERGGGALFRHPLRPGRHLAAYVICGGLTGSAAVLFAMYTRSISPASHGKFYELYAIAAAVLGGCSLRGGEGSVIGVVLGTVLLQVLQNLVNLLGIPSSLNFAVMGAVILIGVLADQYLVQRRQRAMTAKGRLKAGLTTAPLERANAE